MNGNFDHVIVKQADGSERSMSSEQFAALPITERVQLVSRGNVSFFRNGERIPATQAFKRSPGQSA